MNWDDWDDWDDWDEEDVTDDVADEKVEFLWFWFKLGGIKILISFCHWIEASKKRANSSSEKKGIKWAFNE